MLMLERINDVVWGIPTLLLILCVGIYLSVCTGFAQIRLLPRALKTFFLKLRGRKDDQSGISPFQALCTALAATVGTGNLAGVAGAIAIGGPGSIFWMWICAFFGMVTKFAEVVLAVHFRNKNSEGQYIGGPMYMIRNGLNKRWHWLAFVYCFFGLIATFGVGNAVQINTVLDSINCVITTYSGTESQILNSLIGIVLAVLIGIMLFGGAPRIAKTAQLLVPFASLLYLLLGMGVLIFQCDAIPVAFSMIFAGAFEPSAVTGGLLGSVFMTMRIGASRGVFTNEAGMGTASIAHASAHVQHPVDQGLLGIVEVFLDTIVICTMTALVILCSGCTIPYGTDPGIRLTTDAFALMYGKWVNIPIMISLCCFAVGTVVGWSLYGGRCAQFLFGDSAWRWFIFAQMATVIVGSVLNTGTIWTLSEIVNALMTVPNLIALTLLTPHLRKATAHYKQTC